MALESGKADFVAHAHRRKKGSKVLDLAQEPRDNVVDEAAYGNFLGNPRMRAEFLQLMAHVFVDVLESIEKGWSDRGSARAILNAGAQLLLGRMHQAAVGVIDDHEFLSAQQMVRDNQGPQRVVGNDAPRIADDVRVAGL